MSTSFSVAGQRVVVVGAARSGLAAARLLRKRGAQVTLTDLSATLPATSALSADGIAVELGEHRPQTFAAADLVVLSPGVAPEQADVARARAQGVPVIGELELASRWLRGYLIAITGTKGKSTTTTLVGKMLSAAGRDVLVGGNIGVPLSAQVDASTPDTIHVVEASSFQLETTVTFHPRIAALLNLSADHLDRHPDEAAYVAAKAKIFANQDTQDLAVVRASDERSIAVARSGRAPVIEFDLDRESGADVYTDQGFVWQRTPNSTADRKATPVRLPHRGPRQATPVRLPHRGPRPGPPHKFVQLLPLAAVRVAGRHTLANVVAAATIARLAGASPAAITEAVASFTGLEHVMEQVATIGSVRFVNDSKATNVDAAARSIESFDRVVAIVGGRYKGGNLEDLREPLAAHGTAVIAVGEARARVAAALESVLPVVPAGSLDEAVDRAWELAQPNGVILLAPACSSFDMFANYAERGERFREAVWRLAAREGTEL